MTTIINLDDLKEFEKYNNDPRATGTFKSTTHFGKNYVMFHKKDGVYHREDGPAIEWSDGQESFYIEGVEFSKEDFMIKYSKLGRIIHG